MRKIAILPVILAGMLLSGCVPRPQKKQAASAGSALPATVSKTFAKAEFNLTARVLDADTGQPIPDAWVLVTARVTTDRPATGGAPNALAAGRMLTGPDGIGRISEVRGIYFPGQPKNKLWLAFEEVRARRLGERRITGIEGGSIVAASPKYGFLHQPFAVEDGAAFEAWLQKNPGPKESYGGWLTRRYLKENLETLFIRSKDLERGFEVTLRMRKPATLDALAEAISPFAFGMGTRSAMSVDTGASEDEQLRIYSMFAIQMDEIAETTWKPEHIGRFETYMREESINYYIGHSLKSDDMDGSIQLWMVKRALEILPRENEEVKRYALDILKGVVDEGKDPAWRNHYYDPAAPGKALPNQEPLLKWGAIDEADNAKNEWDWQDARRYYQAGDKEKAYEALGHVLRLLTNLSIPKYTQMRQEKESEFEKAMTSLLKSNGNNLPPEYYLDAKNPKVAADLKERFDAVAKRTMEESNGNTQTPLAGETMRNGYGGVPWGTTAKKTFPSAIEQAAGVMRDFQGLMNPVKVAAVPGDGGNGPDKHKQEVAVSTRDVSTFSSPIGSVSVEKLAGNPRLERDSISEFKEAMNHVSLATGAAHGRFRILATKERLQFFDDQGNVKRAIVLTPTRREIGQWSEVHETKGGRYVGVNEVLDYDGAGETVKDGRFKMFDAAGNLLWEIKHRRYRVIPSPSGKSALAESDPTCGPCPLIVYGKNGLVREIPKPDTGYSAAFSQDGKLAVLSFNNSKSKKGHLSLFDEAWTQTWTKDFEAEVGDVAVSNTAKLISAVFSNEDFTKRWLQVFDMAGNMVFHHDIGLIGSYLFQFSKDDSRLLIASDGNSVHYVDLGKRTSAWNYRSEGRGMFRAIAATPNLDFIVLADPGYGEMDDCLHLLNGKGELLFVQEMGKNYFYYDTGSYAPLVEISSDGQQIGVVSKRGMEILKNPFAIGK